MKVINISDFQNLEIRDNTSSANVVVERVSDSVVSIESLTTTSTYFNYKVPYKVPVGAKVRVVVNARTVSGDAIRCSIDGYENQSYITPKVTLATSFGYTSDEFKDVVCIARTDPDSEYIAITFGYFDSKIGKAEIRNVRIEIDGLEDEDEKDGWSPTTDRYFTFYDLQKQFLRVTDGDGVITDNASSVSLSANNSSRAYMRYGYALTVAGSEPTRIDNLNKSNGFVVELDVVSATGTPLIICDYKNSSDGGVTSVNGVVLAKDNSTVRYWFPPHPDAQYAIVVVGFASANGGTLEIEGMRITQYDNKTQAQALSVQPFCCMLKKESGGWIIDNDSSSSLRFAYSNIETISQTTTEISLGYGRTVTGFRPVFNASVDGVTSGAATYYAVPIGVTNTGVDIEIYDHATNTRQNPSSIADNTYIHVVGVGVK